MAGLNRVLLVHPDGNTFNNPTLKCVIDLLLEYDVAVDIRYPKSCAPMPHVPGVFLLPYGPLYRKFKSIGFYRLCSRRLAWFSVWVEHKFIYNKYDLVIGVDRQGLIEASLLHQMTGTPVVFFSFEIMFESETSAAFKALEREASKQVRHWFVQDEVRAGQIQQENGLNPSTRILLPLASSGPGAASPERLRDKLGIPPEKKVAIAIGSVSAWSMAREIVASVASWPDDWVLIVHERYGRTTDALDALGLKPGDISNGKVYISSQTTAMVDDMGEILAGISAGLAFYHPNFSSIYTGKNLEYVGLSSGKISTFLRYGVPILMNEIGLYAKFAREHCFGLVVQEPSELGAMLPLLEDSSWGNNARIFYESHLDFSNFRDVVMEKLIGDWRCD